MLVSNSVSALLAHIANARTVSDKVETNNPKVNAKPIPGAEQTSKYFPYLKGKRIGIVANLTSTIGGKLSVDSLFGMGVKIVKIFGPEHGFRGDASRGIKVDDSVDHKTGVQIISLYGKTEKPTKEHLADVDLIIFDMQDVGARFYTRIQEGLSGLILGVLFLCAKCNLAVPIVAHGVSNTLAFILIYFGQYPGVG